MNSPTSDINIPVLTEIINPQPDDAAAPAVAPAPPSNAAAPAVPATPAIATPVTVLPAIPTATSAQALTQQTHSDPLPSPVIPAASIPVAAQSPQEVPNIEAKPSQEPATTEAAPGLPALTDEQWEELENDIHQRISKQVLARIDFVLDHRIRNSLTDVVDKAIDGLAAEIKRGLHETLEDIISRAVAQEMTRIHPLKK